MLRKGRMNRSHLQAILFSVALLLASLNVFARGHASGTSYHPSKLIHSPSSPIVAGQSSI
jgi:hypothetical protein